MGSYCDHNYYRQSFCMASDRQSDNPLARQYLDNQQKQNNQTGNKY